MLSLDFAVTMRIMRKMQVFHTREIPIVYIFARHSRTAYMHDDNIYIYTELKYHHTCLVLHLTLELPKDYFYKSYTDD